MKAVSRWLVRSIPVNRITVCKCQVTYFLFLELGCSRSNDWKNTVILLFPLCQSLSLPYFFFFVRSLAKPKDFVHIFNSIYVINCLTSLVSTMTDVSKRLYQSLKQNKTKWHSLQGEKKESVGPREKWLPSNSIHFLEGREGRNGFSLTAPSPRVSWGKFSPVRVHCRLDQPPSFST